MNNTRLAKLTSAATPEVWQRTFGYYFIFVCLGLSTGILGPTLPSLAEQVKVSVGQMGLLFFIGSLGATTGTFIGGRMFGKLRGHMVLGLSQLAIGALIALVPFAPNLWLLALILLVKAFAEGLINTGANTLMLWSHGEKVGPFMNGLHFFFGLGAFLAPFLLAQLVSFHISYHWAFWALAVFDLVVGLRVLLLPGDPQHTPQKTEQGHPAVKVNYSLVLISFLFLFFYVGAEIAFGGWIFTYATVLKLTNEALGAYLTSAFWLAFTIGRLISVAVATRFSARQVISTASLACLAFLGILILLPGSQAALWITTAGLGFCMAPIWPTGFTLAGQILPQEARVTSLVLLGDSFGGMVLPWLVGRFLDLTGPRAMVFLVFASLVANLAAFLGMRKPGKQLAQSSMA